MALAERTLIDRVIDGRYRVVRHIADGGMGSVYAAVDLRLERDVALKVMRADLSRDPTFVERFRKEARSAARLNHPHVVSVHDQGEDEGVVFLTMELVEGPTLRAWLRQATALTPREALGTMEEVLSALAAAHRAGIVHRDIKPENVLLSTEGVVKVADFGLARAVASTTATALTGTLMGTVAYLAPEQVERGVADARSDVYAAGLMLHEMLTGRQAVHGDSPIHVAFQHVHGRLPAPSEHAPGLPSALDDLVGVATRRDPDARPVDAGEWLEMLRASRDGLTAEQLDTRPTTATSSTSDTKEAAATKTKAMTRRSGGTRRRTAKTTGAPGAAGAAAGAAAASGGAVGASQSGPGPSLSATNDTDPGGNLNKTGILARATQVIKVDRGDRPASPTAAASASPDKTTGKSTDKGTDSAASATSIGEAMVAIGAAGHDPGKDGRSARRAPSRRRRIAIVAALIVALSGGGTWYAMAGPGSERPVPPVAGTTQYAALAALEGVDLRTQIVEEYSETVPKGEVISTEPEGGQPAWRYSTVTLAMSLGPERYAVPDVTGKTPEEAAQLISDTRLTVGPTREAYHDTVEVGRVYQTTPKIGTELKPGTEVRLAVSRGPEPIELVDWRGKPVSDAEKALEEAGVAVVRGGEEFSSSVPAGAILTQSPGPGTVYRGDTVTFVVSKGPDMVAVPNVRGENANQARRELESAGFTVRIERIAGGLFGTAHSTDPAGGQRAPRGSTITLRIV
ncbi:serine/threonine-protein kinase [Kineosphaera limosa]|uniref:Stk1 family PASTA domain-containing Ser/Thr kinase n=1 Tax=Kineosphaera limosa TaxID=111564 RepID=UPI000312F0D4|nr:Stk1 family PASTA domain-containing Ser/Thr kinase [Kineosphaera limosa]NYD99020.1 serine/threonine-protein kinase [Kineosphaera limosa]